MNFGWGKTYLYIFLICVILSNPYKGWFEWVAAFLFLGSCFFNLYIGRKYATEEMERVRDVVTKIQAKAEASAEN